MTLWTVACQALYPWDFAGNSTGVGSHSLLHGIFLTQGSNVGLLHCRQILYCLSHREALLVYGFRQVWELLSHCLFGHSLCPPSAAVWTLSVAWAVHQVCVSSRAPRLMSVSGNHTDFVFCRCFVWETKSGLYYSILTRSRLLMFPKEVVKTLLEALGLE